MSELFPLRPPLSPARLERLRLRLRRQAPAHGTGVHLRRKLGQSLEFRELADYQLGDDLRTIDWLASLRKGQQWELVRRTFEAENQMTIAIAIDSRPSMYLPEGAAKIRIATWIMQCLVRAAVAEGDRVVLASMYHPTDATVRTYSGGAAIVAAEELARKLLANPPSENDWIAKPVFDPEPLIRRLPPTAALAVISDFYLDADDPVGRLIRQAQRGYRQFTAVELDSWPMERTRLAGGPLRLARVGNRDFGEELLEVPEDVLNQTSAAMDRNRAVLRHAWNRGGLVWPGQPFSWPAVADLEPDQFGTHFAETFVRSEFLGSLLAGRAS